MENRLWVILILKMKEQFKERICLLAREHAEANYANYGRDFGDRFCAGAQGTLGGGFLYGGPFSELSVSEFVERERAGFSSPLIICAGRYMQGVGALVRAHSLES